MRKHSRIYQFKEAFRRLKEQGAMSDDAYAALCKELKRLDHGFAIRDQKLVVDAVAKISNILWEITR